jgi:hypothetical protein
MLDALYLCTSKGVHNLGVHDTGNVEQVGVDIVSMTQL